MCAVSPIEANNVKKENSDQKDAVARSFFGINRRINGVKIARIPQAVPGTTVDKKLSQQCANSTIKPATPRQTIEPRTCCHLIKVPFFVCSLVCCCWVFKLLVRVAGNGLLLLVTANELSDFMFMTHVRKRVELTAAPKTPKYTAMTSKSAAAMALNKEPETLLALWAEEAVVLLGVPMIRDVAMKLTLPPIKDANRQDKAARAWSGRGSSVDDEDQNNRDNAMDTRHPKKDAKLAIRKGRPIFRTDARLSVISLLVELKDDSVFSSCSVFARGLDEKSLFVASSSCFLPGEEESSDRSNSTNDPGRKYRQHASYRGLVMGAQPNVLDSMAALPSVTRILASPPTARPKLAAIAKLEAERKASCCSNIRCGAASRVDNGNGTFFLVCNRLVAGRLRRCQCKSLWTS